MAALSPTAAGSGKRKRAETPPVENDMDTDEPSAKRIARDPGANGGAQDGADYEENGEEDGSVAADANGSGPGAPQGSPPFSERRPERQRKPVQWVDFQPGIRPSRDPMSNPPQHAKKPQPKPKQEIVVKISPPQVKSPPIKAVGPPPEPERMSRRDRKPIVRLVEVMDPDENQQLKGAKVRRPREEDSEESEPARAPAKETTPTTVRVTLGSPSATTVRLNTRAAASRRSVEVEEVESEEEEQAGEEEGEEEPQANDEAEAGDEDVEIEKSSESEYVEKKEPAKSQPLSPAPITKKAAPSPAAAARAPAPAPAPVAPPAAASTSAPPQPSVAVRARSGASGAPPARARVKITPAKHPMSPPTPNTRPVQIAVANTAPAAAPALLSPAASTVTASDLAVRGSEASPEPMQITPTSSIQPAHRAPSTTSVEAIASAMEVDSTARSGTDSPLPSAVSTEGFATTVANPITAGQMDLVNRPVALAHAVRRVKYTDKFKLNKNVYPAPFKNVMVPPAAASPTSVPSSPDSTTVVSRAAPEGSEPVALPALSSPPRPFNPVAVRRRCQHNGCPFEAGGAAPVNAPAFGAGPMGVARELRWHEGRMHEHGAHVVAQSKLPQAERCACCITLVREGRWHPSALEFFK